MYSPIPQQNNLNSSQKLISQTGVRKQFLKFHLEPDTKIMLPILEVTEVLKIPLGKIVPIPQMPPWTMGIYNWRGEILWTIDLGHLLGLHTWYQQKKNHINYNVIVISSGKQKGNQRTSGVNLGLIITQIEDIEWYDSDLIQSLTASMVNPEIAPFLEGYLLNPEGQMILVLKSNFIMDAMPKISH